MPIPAYDLGGVLPPFLGSIPGSAALQSPYLATPLELVHRFGVTDTRHRYIRGLLTLRSALRDFGIDKGIQWIDGSFVENKEANGGEPGDIDIVTVFERPAHLGVATAWAQARAPLMTTLFDPGYCKLSYHCEAFYIDAGLGGLTAARQAAFWFGLFSHQRLTYRWKGLVELPLGPSLVDRDADAELARRGW